MKWLGWSYPDLLECPTDLLPVIQEAMQREAEAHRRAARRR